MKHSYYKDIPLEKVTMEGAKKAGIRRMVIQNDGAPNFAMRMFEIEPGGFTPYHSHSWEHENFIVEGEGVLTTEDGEVPFKAGDIIYVDPNFVHNYKNTGNKVLKFLCIIPHEKSRKEKKKVVNPFASEIAKNC